MDDVNVGYTMYTIRGKNPSYCIVDEFPPEPPLSSDPWWNEITYIKKGTRAVIRKCSVDNSTNIVSKDRSHGITTTRILMFSEKDRVVDMSPGVKKFRYPPSSSGKPIEWEIEFNGYECFSHIV